jgi:Ca2+-binding RTX toxin-like protein
VGTSGDDIFLVSQSETVVQAGTGNDVVRSSASWTMSAGVEALLLTGTSSIYGIGTVAADIIGGNDAANILTGLGGNDTLSGSGGNDTLQGGDGSDRLLGGAGTDTLEGGANTDTLEGGGDNDIYILTDAGDAIVEGLDGGTADRVMTGWSSTLAVNVEQLQLTGTAAVNGTGNDSDNTMVGNGAGNILTGLAGNDTIDGLGGSDLVRAGAGNDVVRSGEGTDRIAMDLGDDLIDGGGTYLDELFFEGTAAMTIDLTKTTAQVTGLGTDTIRNIENVSGGGGNDRITGNDRWNLLQGGAGNDRLYGGTGRDRLEGGSGRDEMLGGSDQDRDVFVFTSVQESAVGTARDAIRQFTRSIDDIDLSAIDANSNMSGNQAFAFSGSTARAYGVWTSALDGNQVVRADVDGDRMADMEIRVDGWARLTASDFVL